MKFVANKTKAVEEFLGTLKQQTFEFTKILEASHTSIKLYDLDTGECLRTFEGHSDWILNIKLINENQIVSCSQDKTIEIWELVIASKRFWVIQMLCLALK